jgi:E3 ubiquitin ligase SMURF1/2
LELVASLPFHEKWIWFVQQMDLLQEPWENGHVLLAIEREHLLQQSFEQFLNLEEQHLHKYLRISFQDEPGLDAGGIEREWFLLLSLLFFSPYSFSVDHICCVCSLLQVHACCAGSA